MAPYFFKYEETILTIHGIFYRCRVLWEPDSKATISRLTLFVPAAQVTSWGQTRAYITTRTFDKLPAAGRKVRVVHPRRIFQVMDGTILLRSKLHGFDEHLEV